MGDLEIDLDRHGIIEAHAGTGKTWTIIQMVLRILEKKITNAGGETKIIPVNEILLVTFTDKAAGELKRRIRKGLEERISRLDGKTQGDLVRHLEKSLNNLHEALIGTIHGVCLRLLQTWPFETGVPFTTEMVDDSEGLAGALRESIRTDWQEEETNIPWALEQLQSLGISLTEKHFDLVRDIAQKLLDGENTVLDRRACGGFRLSDLKERYESEYQTALPGFLDNVHTLGTFLDGFTIPATLHENAKAAVSAVGKWAKKVLDGKTGINPETVASLSKFKKPDKNGRLVSANICDAAFKKTPGGGELDALFQCVQTHRVIDSLETLKNNLLLTFVCDAAELLRDRWSSTKEGKGFLSFMDMVRLMHKAVTGNQKFVESLRARLRYGIIDECQDTSSLQWRIFKKIFLETQCENGPRIFIVGDPKQSIYAFQGADVRSYLEAKRAIIESNGRMYPLTENFRSLGETIDGCNAVFARKAGCTDWFAFEEPAGGPGGRISYPSDVEGGGVAKAHSRSPEYSLDNAFGRPVQIMVLEGNASERTGRMAELTAQAIQAITAQNKKVKVPDGDGWREITLSYEHCAVIIEKHRFAEPFLEEFQRQGIPAVKYRMEGVFQSAMARDLHALLRAILHPSGEPAPRLAALLTLFFNRNPVDLDPEKDLEPCQSNRKECRCIFHALEEWTFLASQQLWSQLFKGINDRTRVRERLITLVDGKRRLADLGQVADYAIEKLYRGNLSLEQLVEHLGRLFAEEERLGHDENLHVLATGRSCVKVLTMHASKGLEFPVVFVVTGGSKKIRRAPGTLSWMDGHNRVVMPSESFAQDLLTGMFDGMDLEAIPVNLQDKQERRRLLYVALTRAQALLFVPAHVGSVNRGSQLSWQERCPLPAKGAEVDLTPKLLGLLDSSNIDGRTIGLFDADKKNKEMVEKEVEAGTSPGPDTGVPVSINLKTLNLPSRICRQTSYTELSRLVTVDRDLDHSEEYEVVEKEPQENEKRQRPFLPGGKQTGDALHLALEELLKKDDSKLFVNNGKDMHDLVKKYLEQNGVLKKIVDEGLRIKAIDAAVWFIKDALSTPLLLPTGGTVSIIDLEKRDRIPEMEFQLGVAPHWVHGYMDLVFRIKNEKAEHPYRYFVLDWKSDQLDTFDEQGLKACMKERHYTLQAKVYCHALDRYLKGLLGDKYDPGQNLGGAVYVFLRSYQDKQPKDMPKDASNDVCHTLTHPADPEEDAKFTEDQLHNLTRNNWL